MGLAGKIDRGGGVSGCQLDMYGKSGVRERLLFDDRPGYVPCVEFWSSFSFLSGVWTEKKVDEAAPVTFSFHRRFEKEPPSRVRILL